MRVLVALMLVLALGWAGYWFIGARAVTTLTGTVFERANAQGLVAGRDGEVVRGFPNRFDLTIDAPRLFDPVTGFGWEAPFVQILALTYRPWHLIAAFAPEQTLVTPFGPALLASDKLQASLRMRPRSTLPLEQLTLVGDGLGLRSDLAGTLTARQLRLATRALDDSATVHEVGLEVLALTPDPALLARLGDVPPAIDRLRIDADLGFDAPIDRFVALEPPPLSLLRLREGLLVWGNVSVRGAGTLVPDAAGRAEGTLELRLENWRQLLPMAVAAGLLKPEVAPTWEQMLAILALQSGNRDTIEVTLRFAAGTVSLGPLPLGPAPMLR